MKKNLFFAVAAVVAMASCAKNEAIDIPASSAIGFDTFVGNATKAEAETAFVAGDKFAVDAYYTAQTSWATAVSSGASATDTTPSLYIDDEDVTAATGDSSLAWSYTNTAYWPKTKDDKISFFAVSTGTSTAPAGSTDGVSFEAYTDAVTTGSTADGYVSFTYTNPTTCATQLDLMVASNLDVAATGTSGTNAKVPFTFKHVLSQIKFTFATDTDYGSTTVITLTSVKLTYDSDFESKALFTYSNSSESAGAWVLSSDVTTQQAAETFTKDLVLSSTPSEYTDATLANPIMVIPQNQSIVMDIEYTVAQTGKAIVTNNFRGTLSGVTGGYAQSKIYTYAIAIGLDAIVFDDPSVEENGWADDTSFGTDGSLTVDVK